MSWNKVFENPNIQALRSRFPTVRGRVIATVGAVDRHLSEAQQALSLLHDDGETREMVHDIFNRLEDLRFHVQKLGRGQKARRGQR